MNCLEFRHIMLTDPGSRSAELSAHARQCAECRRFSVNLQTDDARTRQAMTVPVPENLAARILLKQSLDDESPRRRARWAIGGIAASMLIIISLAIMRTLPASALDQKIAAHLDSEQMDVAASRTAVKPKEIQNILGFMDRTMSKNINQVQFARLCIVDYRLVAHLVLVDNNQRFTILLMPQPPGDARRQFISGHWHGIIVERSGGSIAVVADRETSSERLRAVASDFIRDLQVGSS